MNKMAITIYLPTIPLNANGLNARVKRHIVDKQITKQDPSICCLQETHFRLKDTHRLKVKGWKKAFHENRNEKKIKAAVATLTPDKIDFKTKAITRDKEGSRNSTFGYFLKGPTLN